MNSTLALVFTFLTLMISLFYLYAFSKHQERSMKFWGLAWVTYSVSLIFLLLYISRGGDIYLEIRKVVDMFNILLLLFGVYAFTNAHIPDYWYRFSLYLLLLSLVCIVYNFGLISFYLPIAVYQVAITCVICYYIIRYWETEKVEKILAVISFALWGVGKALLPMYALFSAHSYGIFIIELILSNIINFCILAVYAEHIIEESNLRTRLYEDVIDNTQDVVFFYNLKPFRCFKYITPSVEKLTGYARNVFYIDSRKFYNLIPSEYVDMVSDIANGDLSYDQNQVIKITKKNKETFWGELRISFIEDDDGSPKAIECVMRDITELRTAQLEEMKAQKERDMMMTYISHELRTPVTSIAGYMTAISDGVISEEDDIKDAMVTITDKTVMLKKLIDDVDQLSKMKSNHFSFELMTYDAMDLTDYLIEKNIPDLKMKGFNVELKKDEGMRRRYIIADKDRINQVFSNILNNAVKYSGSRITLDIAFDIDASGSCYNASVRDFGPGISKDEKEMIFTRFYRGKNTANSEIAGSGLGLTLSKEIMKAHNGDITVESEEGKGSRFTIVIPLYEEETNG